MDGLQANSLEKVRNVEWPQSKRQPRRLGGGVGGGRLRNRDGRKRKMTWQMRSSGDANAKIKCTLALNG